MKRAILYLRIGLAFSFFYAAIASFLNPSSWIGFFPLFLQDLVPEAMLLGSWSIIEILMGIWLLSGKWLKGSAFVSAFLLAGVVVTNLALMDILFRDVSLFFAALALFALSREQ